VREHIKTFSGSYKYNEILMLNVIVSCRRLLLQDEEFDIKLVIREWVDIEPELEFRGFVYNKQLKYVDRQHAMLCHFAVRLRTVA
jgi:hypothetical protein